MISVKLVNLLSILTFIYFSSKSYADNPRPSWINHWMEYYSDSLKDIPLNQLLLPATHDSGSYAITGKKEYCKGNNDSDNIPLKDLTKDIVALFAQTQGVNIFEQLNQGARYIDLRVCQQNNEFWSEHTLLSDYYLGENGILNQIKKFAENHTKEILILDFNHFYSMDQNFHKLFAKEIINKLGSFLIPSNYSTNDTLQKFWNLNKNIIVIYHNDEITNNNNIFWSSNNIYSPWANTNSTETLTTKLTEYIKQKPNEKFFVLQGILTLQGGGDILKYIWTGGLRGMAQDAYKVLLPFIDSNINKPLNLLMIDWADDQRFSEEVVHFNLRKFVK